MEPVLPRLLLAGLGNIPYPNTRHSLGHVVIDALANRWRINFKKNALGWSGQSTVRLSGARSVSIVLFKPDKLMNVSGPPIAQAAKQADHLFVLHDFTARKIGHIGVIRDAPPGGHNGLKSVKQAYQKPFWSVRLGIGHPGPGADLADYVLGKLSPSELNFWQAEGAALVAESLEVAFGKAVGGEGKDGARNLTFRPQSPRERP